jgi:SEC-C motif domain protein
MHDFPPSFLLHLWLTEGGLQAALRRISPLQAIDTLTPCPCGNTAGYPSTRPAHLKLAAQQPAPTWLGLDVKYHEQNGEHATVEFIARLRYGGGKAQRMHEVSRFVREGGCWYYLDGRFPEA